MEIEKGAGKYILIYYYYYIPHMYQINMYERMSSNHLKKTNQIQYVCMYVHMYEINLYTGRCVLLLMVRTYVRM